MTKKKKDWGEHDKKTEARNRKASIKAEESNRRKKEAEDAYWQKAGEGVKSKAQLKKEEAERKRQEAIAKKAENKLLIEKEESEFKSKNNKQTKISGPKVINIKINLILFIKK